MALSKPNRKPAPESMNRLMNMTTSPTEKTDLRSRMMATISVPSSDPPKRMMSPTPSPSMMPPNMAARNGSSVKRGSHAS